MIKTWTLILIFVFAVPILGANPSLHELNQEILLLYQKKQYPAALKVAKRALRIARKQFVPVHGEVANLKNALGNIYYSTGDFKLALENYEAALKILEKTDGPEHTNVALTLDNIARVYEAKGNWAKATTYYERSITIREKSFGSNHPVVADAKLHIARNYFLMEEFQTAETLYREALRVYKLEFGGFHRKMSAPLRTVLESFNAEKSLRIYTRVLAIEEDVLGKQHPNIALIMGYFGRFHLARNELKKAEDAFRRSVTIQKKNLEKDPPEYIYALVQLAKIYEKQGQVALATVRYTEAMKEMERKYGRTDPILLSVINPLMDIYRKSGNVVKLKLLEDKIKRIQSARKNLPKIQPADATS